MRIINAFPTSCKYLETPTAVEEFKVWIKTLPDPDGTLTRWWSHKLMHEWILPGCIQCLSGIDKDTWNIMEATTNLGEAQHKANNAMGREHRRQAAVLHLGWLLFLAGARRGASLLARHHRLVGIQMWQVWIPEMVRGNQSTTLPVVDVLANPFSLRGHEPFELFISTHPEQNLSILRAHDLGGNECFHDIDLV
ncbi:hypothetical protein B0H14DRAFT_2597649 [Mycena olivaceomarginata]|nr:hypothetical protein B0H14DRAFT_2597649 [Mycena olivaceomarginata]